MKKYSLYIACAAVVCFGIIAYTYNASVLTTLVPDQQLTSEDQSLATNKTLSSNLDSIPDYIAPEVLKTQLSADQKKQYAKLNETQQKEALSAMGHQQSLKDVNAYGEIELNRLQELDKELAQQDKRADEIIELLNAKVALQKAERESLNSQ